MSKTFDIYIIIGDSTCVNYLLKFWHFDVNENALYKLRLLMYFKHNSWIFLIFQYFLMNFACSLEFIFVNFQSYLKKFWITYCTIAPFVNRTINMYKFIRSNCKRKMICKKMSNIYNLLTTYTSTKYALNSLKNLIYRHNNP